MGDSQQREKPRPGGLAVAEVSPALAAVAGLAASASATWSLSTASWKEKRALNSLAAGRRQARRGPGMPSRRACATHLCSTPFYSGVQRKLFGEIHLLKRLFSWMSGVAQARDLALYIITTELSAPGSATPTLRRGVVLPRAPRDAQWSVATHHPPPPPPPPPPPCHPTPSSSCSCPPPARPRVPDMVSTLAVVAIPSFAA